MWVVLTLDGVEVSPASLDLVISPFPLPEQSSSSRTDLLCVGFPSFLKYVLYPIVIFVAGLMDLGLDNNMGLFVVRFMG
jgi:hypothetical protein